VIERFSRIAGSLLAKIAENERESRTLAALRDTLLPKLISGEVRMGKVPELSSLCEDASRRSRC
jgi:type I restriction enzyme S subunit